MPAIAAWYKIVKSKEVDWKKPQDVVTTFGSERVDILQNDRVCIDLGGNNARIILKVEYGLHIAFVRWIGWHKDYIRLGKKYTPYNDTSYGHMEKNHFRDCLP